MTETIAETTTESFEPLDPEVESVALTFKVNVANIGTVREALAEAALEIGLHGLDNLYVLAEDRDDETRAWVVHQGAVVDAVHEDITEELDKEEAVDAEDDGDDS